MSEEIELLRLRAKAKLKLQNDREANSRLEDVETGPIEAGTRAAAQAATLDFADEIEAGIDTVAGFVQGEEYTSLEDLSKTYNENLDQSRAEFAKNKLDHPTADTVGTGIGVVASLAIPGGAIAKGTTMTAKAASAAKIGAAYGAFGAVGRSEDKLSLKGAMDAAEGAVIGAAGGAVISSAIGGVSKLARAIPEGEGKRLINSAFKGIGLNSVSARKKFAQDLKKKGVQPLDWLKRISKEKDVNGKPLINNINEGFTTIYTKADNKIIQYAEQRDDILKAVKVKLNREDVAKQIKGALVGSKGSSTKDAAFLNSLVDDIVVLKKGIVKTKEQGEILGKVIDESPLDAIGLSALRKNLDSHIKFDSVANSNAVKQDVRTIFNDMTDNLIANNVDDVSAGVGKELRSKMSDLYSLQDSLKKGIEHETFGENAVIKDLMAGAQAKMMTSWMGKGVSDAAQLTAILLRQMAVSPRINRSMSFNALRVADALPNVAEASLRRLLTISENGDMMQFNEEVAAVVAESDMSQDPLPRSVESAFDRKDSIMALVQSHVPDAAEGLRKAFNGGDDEGVAAILTELANHPDAQSFFEEGVGFDGRVYSQEDKATLERQLKMSDVPAAQRVQMLNELRSNGVIPDFESVVRPLPKSHVPKTKKVHDY